MSRKEALIKKLNKLQEERAVLFMKSHWDGADYCQNRILGDKIIKYNLELRTLNA